MFLLYTLEESNLKLYFTQLEPGEIEFSQPVYVVKESIGTFEVQVDRKNGADGQVSVAFKTTDINAIADKDYISNYSSM